ncbi:MAG: hypothetical protein IJ123_09685 [Blautia sp.]|nr:hypothetical protein [Blautia sp.]
MDNTDNTYVILVMKQRTYMTVKDMSKWYGIPGTRTIDEWTVQDSFDIIDKPDKMKEFEEMLEVMNLYVPSGLVQLDGHGGVLV